MLKTSKGQHLHFKWFAPRIVCSRKTAQGNP